MNAVQQTSKAFFRSLLIIFSAMLVGQILFLAVVVYLKWGGAETGKDLSIDPLFIVAPVMAFFGIFASHLLYKWRIKAAFNASTLSEKLVILQSALIMRLALLEGPALFSIVIYLMTGNQLLLALTALLIVVFILVRPIKEKLINDLQLNAEERMILSKDDEVVIGK